MFEWSDLRILLAVARHGSTLAAAKALGVNQTTVARRIAALEAATGVRFFDRRNDGYRLSECGKALLERAEKVEEEVLAFESAVRAQKRELGGSVRLTTTEVLANAVVTPWLAEFMEQFPDIRVEMVATERRLDLAAGEADVAIRAQKRPDDSGVVVQRLSDAPWSLYCSVAYAERRGIPRSVDELVHHNLIGGDGPLASLDPFLWLKEAIPPECVRSSCVSVLNMLSAVKAGHGVGALPCSQAVHEPTLTECFAMPDFGYGYYLVTNAALKDVPRVRALLDFISARAFSMRYLLDGRSHLKER